MAVRVTDLTAQDLADGFSRVIVVGLRAGGADAGQRTLESCRYAFDTPATEPPRMNVNQATIEELQALPGVDAAAASAIVAARGASGFRRLAALVGIGGLTREAVDGLRRFATTGVDHLSLDELGIEAIDLVAMSGSPLQGADTEIETRIRNFVRTEFGLPPDTPVTLAGARPAGYAYGLEEALEFAKQALNVLGAGSPLRPDSQQVPSGQVDTRVAFQFDAPGTQAPQAQLLAVPSKREIGVPWSTDELAEIVRETMDLAKIRAVDADAMGERAGAADNTGVGAALPALMLPTDPAKPGWGRKVFADGGLL